MDQARERLAGWEQAAIDSTMACAQTALAAAEQLLRLNLAEARSALEQHSQATRELLVATDPQALMRLRSRMVRETMQRAAAYAQEVYELLSETQAQIARHAGSRLAGAFDDLACDAAQTGAPGAEVAVAAVKSTLAASAAMMDNLDRVTRQFAGLSEAAAHAAVAELARAGDPARGARP